MILTLHEKLISDKKENYLFSLSIINIESYPIRDSIFFLSSDILPEIMLEKFSALISPQLIFEQDVTAPDIEYLEELLEFIGDLVLQDPDFKPFYYPSFMIDSEKNVRHEVTRQLNNARQEIRLGKEDVYVSSNELHLFYFKLQLQIPKKYTIYKNIRIERISRIVFEKNLTSHSKAEAYVDIYFSAERFKLITNTKRESSYFLALNKKNEPILAITADEQN